MEYILFLREYNDLFVLELVLGMVVICVWC